jgi:hypothetical protein
VPAPVITEYQLQSKTCACCGAVTTADWTAADDVNTQVVAPAGSPVRIGPRALAMCALLTCGHYLSVGRATALLETLTGLHLATGFTARARRRAAKKLTATFLPHMKDLLATAPMLHADETTGRAAGAPGLRPHAWSIRFDASSSRVTCSQTRTGADVARSDSIAWPLLRCLPRGTPAAADRPAH